VDDAVRGQAGELIEVVAGVVRDDRGRVLLAQRPEGKHLAGTWEFPGGKREPGESGRDALIRELREELGIAVGDARPWLGLTHRYPELTVRLQLYTVDTWSGEPNGREGQPIDWLTVDDMTRLPMPAADRPIVRAFGLHEHYAVTPDPADVGVDSLLEWTRDALDRGIRLFQLRANFTSATDLAALGRRFDAQMKARGARWLLNGPAELVAELGADGIHLDRIRLGETTARPFSGDLLVAAACGSESELARAGELALDFVTVSPVRTSAGHSDATPLGWEGFERLCRLSPLPVYALGGVGPDDLDRARRHGGFGVAGMHAFGAR
jgi:8-oxo-dGTP diphosphatase